MKLHHWHTLRCLLAALAVCCALGAVAAGSASAYRRTGVYQTFGELPRDWHTPYRLVDGIPLVDYGSFKARNPVTSAQYGLANYSLWLRYHDHLRWVVARRVANWLVRTQRHDGKWVYSFSFQPPGAGEPLARGWSSSLAQAQGLSLLERVYRRTHGATYLKAIERAIKPLRVSVGKGGLSRRYHGRLFFEEYPTAQINFSFNGDLQTLIGLYDADDLVPAAKSLFSRGVKTVAANLAVFDSHAGYSLYSIASPTPPPPGYNPAIRSELRILAQLTGRAIFSRYAEIWSAP